MRRLGSVRNNAEAFVVALDESGLGRPDIIVSGGADGADAAAEAVSLLLGVPMVVMTVGGPSDGTQQRRRLAEERDIPWLVTECTRYRGGPGPGGKPAYLARNCAMAELVSRHNGGGLGAHVDESSGTQHMFDSLESHGVDNWVRWQLST